MNCDNVATVPVDPDDEPVGHLDEATRARLDRALRDAPDVVDRAGSPTGSSAATTYDPLRVDIDGGPRRGPP